MKTKKLIGLRKNSISWDSVDKQAIQITGDSLKMDIVM